MDGAKQAELYLRELGLKPDYIGSNLIGHYLDKIRPYPKNAKVKGLDRLSPTD